ncbi:hypothetical protein GR925_25945 [Streptomyces sp. HUCO-GS316]|uniref:hypothetical protein n=1 Tax=Streptomyces sp. HUCO-GS316 TaxID=2692198 RepID=UPI00136B3499|nr:hypothetical protein [Streptomyces sp. HUCO-GS316]MXM66780.1 hypothetical protein [Streptomyces sp. HUCO-GS316]
MGMHQYECGKCGLRSGKHFTRSAAERSGQTHRDEVHGGMHPVNESILTFSGQMPTAADWRMFVLLGALLLAGVIHQAVTG